MKFEELYRARTDALDVPELDADELRRKAAENAGDAHRAVLPAASKRGFKIKYAAFAATAAVLVNRFGSHTLEIFPCPLSYIR